MMNKKEQDRLEKLSKDWCSDSFSFFPDKISAEDLRLLLTHFPPLQELIRQIAHQAPSHHKLEEKSSVGDELPIDAQSVAAVVPTNHSNDRALQIAKDEIQSLKQQLAEEQNQRLSLVTQIQQAQTQSEALSQRVADMDKQYQHALQNAANYRAQWEALKKQQTPQLAEVNLLKSDQALAKRFGLEGLDDNQQLDALIRVVSVFSQLDNIKRLWDVLKDRCESENRAANQQEQALLQSALNWHNQNWKQKPFQLYCPNAGENFDFDKQQRVSQYPSGDNITAVCLSGIQDGSAKIVKKSLVKTQ